MSTGKNMSDTKATAAKPACHRGRFRGTHA